MTLHLSTIAGSYTVALAAAVYQMLGAPTDSPQYSQMTALLDERFEHVSSPFDDAIAAIRNGESP